MKTVITRMLRIGTLRWRVHLACGHAFDVSTGDSLRQQLYIGKQFECPQCNTPK